MFLIYRAWCWLIWNKSLKIVFLLILSGLMWWLILILQYILKCKKLMSFNSFYFLTGFNHLIWLELALWWYFLSRCIEVVKDVINFRVYALYWFSNFKIEPIIWFEVIWFIDLFSLLLIFVLVGLYFSFLFNSWSW